MMMKLWIKDNSIKDKNMGTFSRKKRKSEFTILVHTKGEKSETLLDSFMYRDYHNGFSTAQNYLELSLLIDSSRNIDEYVAKELHLSLSTSQSEGASGSGSNDTRSSKSLHSMNLELIRFERC